jgi:hypothetical protein
MHVARRGVLGLTVTLTVLGRTTLARGHPAEPPVSPTRAPQPFPHRVYTSMPYQPGWNIVAGNALHLLGRTDGRDHGMPGATDSLIYGLNREGIGYTTPTSESELINGQGYWVHFVKQSNAALSVQPGNTGGYTLPAGHWVLIGNPDVTTVQVSGADVLYIYDPTSGYQPATSLAPGQGAVAYSAPGGVLTFTTERP